MDLDTSEANDAHCLGRDQADALLAGAPWRRLLVMGDSIAVGVGDPVAGYADLSWADRLAAALGRVAGGGPPATMNLGRVGARVAEVRSGQLDAALAFRPDLAVVAAGANDAIGRSFDAPAVTAGLDAVVGALRGAGALVVTFGCFDLGRTSFLPPERRPALTARLGALGRLTESVARRHGGVHVDFLRHPAMGDGLVGADRLHPNRRGHAIVAAEVTRALGARLAAGARTVPART